LHIQKGIGRAQIHGQIFAEEIEKPGKNAAHVSCQISGLRRM
jgi:hypothetical protein